MAKRKVLNKSEIKAALTELNKLCKDEYGIELERLLLDRTPLGAKRMQRLTGIVLKKKFARRSTRHGFSETKARRSWPWKRGSPVRMAAGAQRELKLLNQLRMPGAWNKGEHFPGSRDDKTPIPWDEFKKHVERERGLFKILALYVDDKLKGKARKTLREYLGAKESRRFEAGLDLSVLLFENAVTGAIAASLGVPTLAVGVALIGIQYGYRKMTDPSKDRLPDGFS